MKPAELLRRLRRVATRRGWELEVMEGSNHTRLRLNGRRSTVGRHAEDIKTGTFHGILKQLGIARAELED